jgi:hypothetical protein
LIYAPSVYLFCRSELDLIQFYLALQFLLGAATRYDI